LLGFVRQIMSNHLLNIKKQDNLSWSVSL